MSHHRDCFPSFSISTPQKDNFPHSFVSPTPHLFHPTPHPPPFLNEAQNRTGQLFVHLNFKATNLKGHLSPFNKKKIIRKINCDYYGTSGWRVCLPNAELSTSTQTKCYSGLSCSFITFIFPPCQILSMLWSIRASI